MEGEAYKSCCPSGEPCNKAYCKCPPGLSCVIKKIDVLEADAKAFHTCAEGCVCITDESHKLETEGGYCICGEGYACSFIKTEGPDAGKVFLECGNGCKCEISGSGNEVVVVKQN